MKRRGFLGLLAGLPFVPKELAKPKIDKLEFAAYDFTIPAPAIVFSNDCDTGIYRAGANEISFAVADALKKHTGRIRDNVSAKNSLLMELKFNRDLRKVSTKG